MNASSALRDKLIKLDSAIGANMVQMSLVVILLSYLFPLPSTPWDTGIVMTAFAIISFNSSINTTFTEFFGRLKTPCLSGYMLFLTHVVCPCIALVLGYVFYRGDEAVRAGLLISSAVPVATTSLMWVAVSGGAVSLAILTVTINALLSPIIIPLSLFITMGATIELNYAELIVKMMVMTTIPSLLGMSFQNVAGVEKCQKASVYLNLMTKCMMFVILYLSSSTALRGFVPSLSTMKLMFVLLIYILLKFMVGYAGFYVLKGKTLEERIAGIFCCGLRNTGVAIIIAVSYFEPDAAIPLIFTMVLQQPVAGLISNVIVKRKNMR